LIAKVPAYRFLSAGAMLVMIAGLMLLSRVSVGTSPFEVTRDIVIIGAGIGVSLPLTLIVVQAGLPRQLVGVATSQITFWRSLGGTISTAILGSILVNRLPMPPTRIGLSNTLHDLFVVAAIVATLSVIASLALREVPLTKQVEELPEGVDVAA
jgi:hypothetical protein